MYKFNYIDNTYLFTSSKMSYLDSFLSKNDKESKKYA